MESQDKLVVALRWAAFLPGAAIAAWVGWLLASLVYRLGLLLGGLDPDGFRGKLIVAVISSVAMGAAFVYAGSRIAPSHRKQVAYLLTVLAIFLAGAASFAAVLQSDWWALAGCIGVALGGAGVAYSVARGELDLDTQRLT